MLFKKLMRLYAPENENGATDGGEESANIPAFEGTGISHDEPLSQTDFDRLMSYDPFAQEEKLAKEDKTEQAQGATEGQPGEGDEQAVPPPEGQDPAKKESAPDTALLQKAVQEAQAEIARLKAAATQTPPAKTATEQPGAEDDKPAMPKYDYEIPDAIVNAFRSEDPTENKAAIQAVLRGVSQTVHQQVMAQVQSIVQELPNQMQNIVTSRQSAQTIFDDFYGNNPDLNNPSLYPLVSTVASQLSQETGQTNYSPEFAQAVAGRVRQLLQSVGGKADPNTAAAAAAAAKPKGKSYMAGQGARPGNTGVRTEADDVRDTLFG